MKKTGEFLIKISASFFFTGYFPFASGTFATVFAIPVYLLLFEFGIFIYVAVTVILFAFGVYVSTEAEKIYAQKDPHKVVIDEVVGFLVTMFLIKPLIGYVLIGFFLFRFFDVLKPYPAKQLQDLKGGMGVMLDDVAAGVYANIILQVIAIIIKK